MAGSDAIIEEIAAVFNATPPDDMVVLNWIGALRSGDYKFGYGLLRSDEDAYDAFGVLAAISVADWTWSAVEGAWSVDGEVFAPTVEQVAGWLGIPCTKETKEAGLPRFIGILINRLTDVGDSAPDHKVIAKLLDDARGHGKATRDRFKKARDGIRGLGTIGMKEYDSVSDLRPYFARY